MNFEIPKEDWNLQSLIITDEERAIHRDKKVRYRRAILNKHMELEIWFERNYFLFNFDAIFPFEPWDYLGTTHAGDYLAIRKGLPIIVELEYKSSTTWLHTSTTIKMFDFILCYEVAEIDHKRFNNLRLAYFSVKNYLQQELEELRLQSIARAMGIRNIPR